MGDRLTPSQWRDLARTFKAAGIPRDSGQWKHYEQAKREALRIPWVMGAQTATVEAAIRYAGIYTGV